ncbi:MAG: hypothetical protein ACRD2B_16785 [Terriglobia bacterium]
MPAEPTQPKAIKAQRIAVLNSGGYVMWARAHYKNKNGEDKETGWSGTYTNPNRHVIDMSTAKDITTGCEMWPEMAAMLGRWATGSKVQYAPNNHTVVFAAYGSTSNPWLEIIE